MKTLEQEIDEILLPKGWIKGSDERFADIIFYSHHASGKIYCLNADRSNIREVFYYRQKHKEDYKEISIYELKESVKNMPLWHKHTPITKLLSENTENLLKVISNQHQIIEELTKQIEELKNANTKH